MGLCVGVMSSIRGFFMGGWVGVVFADDVCTKSNFLTWDGLEGDVECVDIRSGGLGWYDCGIGVYSVWILVWGSGAHE